MTFEVGNERAFDDGRHLFATVNAEPEEEVLRQLADEYVRLRTLPAAPLTAVSLEGITVVDPDRLRNRLRQLAPPARRGGKFDVLRSDFGECLGYLVLERAFKTKILRKSLRYREVRDLPARGLDIIGIEEGETLSLVLGEAKVSDQSESPPDVVDHGHESLSGRLTSHITQPEKTSEKLWEAARQSSADEPRDLLFRAALLWDSRRWDRLGVTCCAFLVRPRALFKRTDFGRLLTAPDALAPAKVRFLIACFSDGIDTLIARWEAVISAMGVGPND